MNADLEAMRRHILSLSVFLLASSLPAPAQQLPVKTYTTTDGLPHYQINRIVRDSRGFLWFCTGEGLARFDGYGFTNFGLDRGLPSDAVTDFLETRKGAYWVATTRGLARFDPRGRPGAGPPMFAAIEPAVSSPGNEAITVIKEAADGTIWIGTQNGLHRLESVSGRETIRAVEIGLPQGTVEQRTVADILVDRTGVLWVASPSGLYRREQDGAATRYTVRHGLPNDFLQTLLEDRDGRLWAGSRLGGLFRFSVDGLRRSLAVDLTLTAPELPTPWIFQLLEAADGRLWAATARGLVEILRAEGGNRARFNGYSTANGLSYFDITALAEDLGGNLWLGTNSAGAMKISRSGFTSYSDREGIRQVSDVFEDRMGRLCFRGVVPGETPNTLLQKLGCFVKDRVAWFERHSVTNGWVTEGLTLQARSGEWWIGSGVGLYRFPAADHLDSITSAAPLAVYGQADGLASPQVYRVFEDSHGFVWASTTSAETQGLARWNPRTARMHDMGGTPGLPSLENELPRSFAEDRAGRIWIGFSSGVARYAEDRFTWFGAREGLPPGPVMDVHLDRSGRVWLAFERSGLARLDDPSAARPAFIRYTTAEGLSSNNLEVITEDRAGFLYAGGGHGLDQLDPSTGRVKHFAAADGLPAGRFRAGYVDRAGVLWFGLTSGLVRYAPPKETTAPPSAVLITGLRIAGVAQAVSVVGERALEPPALAPDQNGLEIDFVGLGFSTGDVLRYQYRLAAGEWSPPGDQRSVTYASLSPGRYIFQVRAVNSAGALSADPASVTFTILRPVWQRWWFLGAAGLVFGLSAYSFYRYRLTRLLEMAHLRTRIATDLHDDIGADLTRIAMLSEVARQTHDPGALVSIARIARESVSAMSDIVWAINPKRESLADLTRRMRQHAEEVFPRRDAELVFGAPDAADGLNLGVDVRRDLLLVFKEAVNNAARHSRCTRIVIDLRRHPDALQLSVADNGVGFDTSAASDGQGLASLRRRAIRLKGTLDIASGGTGTTVTLRIPL